MTPKFKEGSAVYLREQKLNARVVKCINADDKADLARQGPRYYVTAAGQTWSAPQDAILAEHRRLGRGHK